MPRIKGSGRLGPVRSLRLPRALDVWFEQRLCDDRGPSASELLTRLLLGGLRLRDGYMTRHHADLTRGGETAEWRAAYRMCLRRTFGDEYLDHLDRWIAAEPASG